MKENNLLIGAALLVGAVAYFALRKSTRQMTNTIMENGGVSDEWFERKLLIYSPKSLRPLYKACVKNPEGCKVGVRALRDKWANK
jgi:hypothetical protein